jgi:hypothetical protein
VRWSSVALLVCGSVLPGAQTQDPRGDDAVVCIVGVADASFPARTALLEQIRLAIAERRGPAAVAELIAALDAGAARSQRELTAAVEALGGRVVHHWWLIPAAAIAIPHRALPALGALPQVEWERPESTHRASIRHATDATNHNADHVQNVLRLTGKGANLALLDSGIDFVSTGGLPHRGFDDPVPNGRTRILEVVDVATRGDSEDTVGHGSSVACVALGRDWRAARPVSDDGFAPDAGVVSYKVTRPETLDAPESAVIQAWHEVARDRVAHDLLVANHSYGGNPDPGSAAQRVMDRLAYYFDILIVTSAGNDGDQTFPTANSQSNANGLTVGSVWSAGSGRAHQVYEFSSFGPLLGDPARTFPDLMAVGESVTTLIIDSPDGDGAQTGTSFSAPMVAGTALLLRGARPDLTFLDTKALILNSVQDLAGRNPGLDRFHYGLGLLRTDLAARAMQQGQIFRGAIGSQTSISFTVNVQAGTPYAATVAWPRTNVDLPQPTWDDLDLEVRHQGRLIAESARPRDLYERVLFVPVVSGAHEITVRTRDNVAAPVPFSLVLDENSGGGKQPGSYELFGAGCTGTAPDPSQGLVLPPNGAPFGAASTRVPFAFVPTRLQQAFLGTWLRAPLSVEALALRRDERQADSPSFTADVEIRLGWTHKTPATLSDVFAENESTPMAVVYARRPTFFPGTSGLSTGPKQFDFVIGLDRPFSLVAARDAGTGPPPSNLLIEFRVYSHSQRSLPFNLFFDAVADPGQRRVYTHGYPNDPTGFSDNKVLPIVFLGPGLAHTAPRLHAVGLPQLGAPFGVAVRDARAGAPAIVTHGRSRELWGPHRLPFDLAPFGAPGCAILTDTFLWTPMAIGGNGQGEIVYPVPADPQLTGLEFYNQALILDAGANPLGIAVSSAGRALIGG